MVKGKSKPPAPSSEPSKVDVPNWPRLSPLVPSSDLAIDTLLASQILTISNFLTPTLSKTYVSFLSSLPLTTTPGRPKRGEATRVNDRYQVWDSGFAERLWRETALKGLVESYGGDDDGIWGGEVLGLNPNIRIYRYSAGQFFDQHYDESNAVTLPNTQPPTQARTTWTLLIYLTSPQTGCVGGQTVFYPEPELPAKGKKKSQAVSPDPIVVGLEVGMALLHKHGDDCLLHEGREVQKGEKWVIRSDLCVRR